MEKVRLLFVLPTLRMGGAEKSLVSLLKSLDPQKVSVDLFLFEHGGVLQAELPEWVALLDEDIITRAMTLEFRTYFSDLTKTRHWLAALVRLVKTILTSSRKKLHLPVSCDWRLLKRYIAAIPQQYDCAIGYLEGTADMFVLDKVTALKKIGWIHTDISKNPPVKSELRRYLDFDELTTISDVCRGALVSYVPQMNNHISIIENITLASDILKKAEESGPPNWDIDRFHILTVGRLEYVKGIDLALAACKELKTRGLSICWHVCGEGVMKDDLETMVLAEGLSKEFCLEGLVANPYPYMKRADVLVQSSRFEGKSIVLDEAKILGKAIVATNYPSVRDQLQDYETGLIAEMNSVALADAVEKILRDSTLRERLQNNCRQITDNSEKVVGQIYNLIYS